VTDLDLSVKHATLLIHHFYKICVLIRFAGGGGGLGCHNSLSSTGNPRYTRSHFTRFRYSAIYGKKAVRKLYSNFAVNVYGGGVTAWRVHQLVTSYQYQCDREC
jgi:hypothetical protein